MVRTLVGTRIRERREARGFRQASLAQDAGISASYLNLIEHNRRGIAGKLLIDIARLLDVDVQTLSEGADTALLQDLQAAAGKETVDVELTRLEEMAGRYPGWAALTAKLHRKVAQLERTIDALSDRLTHDPFLSESLHEVLSTVTAIRSTSSILAQHADITAEQRRRFHTNLYAESQRLSDTSRALVSYFDQTAEAGQYLSTPLDEVEAFLSAHSFHFPELEAQDRNAIEPLVSRAEGLSSMASKAIAQKHLETYFSDAQQIPLSEICELGLNCDYAPDVLAREFRVPLHAVFRRLAFLPPSPEAPAFGLVACDGSGAVTLRKALPGFALPRYGAACPLWPLYQSIARPDMATRSVLETPEGACFQTYAQCVQNEGQRFDGARVYKSMMLIRPIIHSEGISAAEPVGLSCRICPRKECEARREPSILA